MQSSFIVPRAIVLAALATLDGCASIPHDRGLPEVQALVDQHSGGDHSWTNAPANDGQVSEPVQKLLSQPLTADAAVQVALFRNPHIQSEFARVGIAQADVFEASRIGNPTFSLTALHHSGEVTKLDGGLSASFSELLMLPARKRFAAGEYQRVQASISAAIVSLISDTRAAWYDYVGAQQVATMRSAVATAAQVSSDLAAQFYAAGNISALQLKLEQAAATQARLQSVRAHVAARRARSALSALMGLSGSTLDWRADDRLPAPLASDESADALVTLARRQRLDLASAQQEVALRESGLELTQSYHLLGKVDVGVAGERDSDGTKRYGPSLSLQLPIFNQGQGEIARSQALLDQSRAQLKALELEVDNSVRLAADRVGVARTIAEDYRTALVPQREAIVARTQEQQNYMLVGVFELLQAKQQEFDAYQGYLEAVRDYWLARVELARAVGSSLPNDGTPPAPTLGPEQIIDPPAAAMPHVHHGANAQPADPLHDPAAALDHDGVAP